MERFDAGALHLAFERAGGQGDPVVLVHGGWGDRRDWARVVPGLRIALQVLAYDRRAHGGSSGAPRGRPVRDDAADLALLLESTALFPAHLVAQGYGGGVALRLAVERPELVRSLALHEPPFVELLPTEASALREDLGRIRGLAQGGSEEAAVRDYLGRFASPAEQWSAVDPRRRGSLVANARAWAEEMADPEAVRPSAQELREVAVPVLLTAGGQSPPFAFRIVERLTSELPNASALRLPEGGHFVACTDPELLVGVLGTFVLERNVPST